MAKKLFKNFSDAFKGLDKAVSLGQKRALNRAAKSTKTFISKEIRGEVGLKAGDINKRLKTNNTASGFNKKFSFRSSVGIATKIGHPLRLFSPKTKKVKVSTDVFGDTRKGVTAKLTKGSREFIPKAFIMQVRGIELVASRKGDDRTPTIELRTRIFIDNVMQNVKKYREFFRKEYKRIVGQQVDYAVQQRLTKNNSED